MDAKTINTTAIGVAMEPNMGLGSLCVIARKRATMIQEKRDRASNAVARGKKPEKIARCNMDKE